MGRRRLRFDVRKNCERKESCSLSVVQCCVSPPEQLLVPMSCNEVVLPDSRCGEVDLSVRIPVSLYMSRPVADTNTLHKQLLDSAFRVGLFYRVQHQPRFV
jgi:hypothetical protein